MHELTTIDDILQWFKEQASSNAPLDPLMYVEAATKLQALSPNEDDKRIELEYEVSKLRDMHLGQEGSSPKAEIKVKANPLYTEWKKQEARCKHITEMVRLGKHWARIRNEQLRAGL